MKSLTVVGLILALGVACLADDSGATCKIGTSISSRWKIASEPDQADL